MSWANARARQVRYLETIDQQFAMILPDDDGMQLDALSQTSRISPQTMINSSRWFRTGRPATSPSWPP